MRWRDSTCISFFMNVETDSPLERGSTIARAAPAASAAAVRWPARASASVAVPAIRRPGPRRIPLPAPFLVIGILSLLTAIWGGLVRLPLPLPLPGGHAHWLTFHGPLMVCGFLGTVIGIERAVGLPDRWPWLAPLLTATGALTLITGTGSDIGAVCLTAGSAVFVAVTLRVVSLRAETFTALLAIGGLAWLIGNLLWLADWPIARVVTWWMAFPGLTIVGERLDLSRFQKPGRWALPLLLAALTTFLVGLTSGAVWPAIGDRLLGLGMIGLAGWLLRFDLARRTIHQPGLPRFMSACLLSGFVWLAVTGMLAVFHVPLQPGASYDATLHAYFIGFVFAMIFGHAPVIFPGVLGRPMAFSRRFYIHVGLLHLSLIMRLAGALAGWPELRQWGAILNGISLVVFLGNTVAGMLHGSRIQVASQRSFSPNS